MANQREMARLQWGKAQEIRANLVGKLEGHARERGTGSHNSRFEEAEQTLAEYRLACMTAIFHDFEYAVSKKVELALWGLHTLLNSEYKKALGRLNTQREVVHRRKLDKLYRAFLKTSEQFYSVYIQNLYRRFSIPELRHIACRSNSQPEGQDAENPPPPAPLRTLVLKSCQMTLVRLGDLVRYRCLVEKSFQAAFDTASDYYNLAISLDPEDGSAHHQLAVLHKIPGQHFDMVYHFHRAIVVARPSELAVQNLKQEFKNPERKGPAKDPSQAMLTWFVQLHAFYYHGKHFSQQGELEEEVLHRVELAFKTETFDNTLLLKMILVNMAAYDISKEKVEASWTIQGSQSCQFLLRFNVRMMLILSRVLDRTLCDHTPTTTSDSTANDGESCIPISPSLLKLLPLFRLYISWSYVTRADLVQFQEYLEPYIKELYRLLPDIFTIFNRYIDITKDTVSSKYLLPEDIEAQGLRPLTDKKLPLFLHVVEHHRSDGPKLVKTRKPQQNLVGHQYKPETEAVWRIRDIMCCGVFLAGSAKFPLVLVADTIDGRDVLSWVFVDGTTTVSSDEASLSRLLKQLNFTDIKVGGESIVEQERKQQSLKAKDTSNATSENVRKASVPQLDNTSSSGKGKEIISDKPSTDYLDSDLSRDSDMLNMVNNLVDSADQIHPYSSQARADSSYGMHSATANEIFANLDSSPVQPSAASKAIPRLPWDWVYMPSPHLPGGQESHQFTTNGNNVPRSASTRFNGATASPYLDTLTTPYQPSLSPRPNTGVIRNSPVPTVSTPGLYRKDYGQDTLEDSRSAVLDSLRSALLAQHGLASDSSSSTNPLNRASPAPWGQQNGISEQPFAQSSAFGHSQEYGYNHTSNYIDRSVNRQLSPVTLLNPIGPPGQGRPPPRQEAPIAGFTRSPNMTSSAYHQANNQHPRGHGNSQNGLSPWPQPLTTTTSPVFSHPSSLIIGTPAAADAATANFVGCNGHYYNASTPFGRSGDGVNNRADPTHFRNQLQAAIGTSELPYDQEILQAAMMDNDRKPRPK
ncbi:hypothetical protein NPX13_g7438 [Xylaria arbuscula]|uniref:Nonsense-mediated mRNA decay factor n=1 Tax=Xylaria arbuscula TaxID=114810 RepID=A0A9W8NAY2_9PEZI|nr:hypothetical protein NPX13_g7438 [Xylaria arbuscula]